MDTTSYTLFNLSEWHREIFDRLFELEFSGRDVLKLQLLKASYKIIDENGSLKIILLDDTPKAPINRTIPVQAVGYDKDNSPIEILLFTHKGLIDTLEIFRVDGLKIINMPMPEDFQMMTLTK